MTRVLKEEDYREEGVMGKGWEWGCINYIDCLLSDLDIENYKTALVLLYQDLVTSVEASDWQEDQRRKCEDVKGCLERCLQFFGFVVLAFETALSHYFGRSLLESKMYAFFLCPKEQNILVKLIKKGEYIKQTREGIASPLNPLLLWVRFQKGSKLNWKQKLDLREDVQSVKSKHIT